MTIGNVNKNQLRLFMTGEEIMAHVDTSVDDNWGIPGEPGYELTKNQTFNRKLREAQSDEGHRSSGLYESMEKHGYRPEPWDEPQQLLVDTDWTGQTTLTHGEGHHRTAVAADLQKKGKRTIYMPVEYHGIDEGW